MLNARRLVVSIARWLLALIAAVLFQLRYRWQVNQDHFAGWPFPCRVDTSEEHAYYGLSSLGPLWPMFFFDTLLLALVITLVLSACQSMLRAFTLRQHNPSFSQSVHSQQSPRGVSPVGRGRRTRCSS